MRAFWLLLGMGLALAACGDDVTFGDDDDDGGSSGEAGMTASGGGNGSGGDGGTGAAAGNGAGGATTGVQCNPTSVSCDGPTPSCPVGEVPEVENGCWGDCVPILECATEPNCDGCQVGFCAEYVGFIREYRCVMPTFMCSAIICQCMSPYFCADPYDVCVDNPTEGVVSCECTTC